MVGILGPRIGARFAATFPTPSFESDYTFPVEQRPQMPAGFWGWLDLGVLALALALAVTLVHYRRSRRGLVALGLFSLLWFGFIKEGCVCAVGSVQNIMAALGTGAGVPLTVLLFFVLPLVVALFWGRVFCAGVCPMGAVQELLLVRPVKVPAPVDTVLGFLPVIYLGFALVFAANQLGFIICEFDPFVRLFRGTGTWPMVATAAVFGILSLVVGRPYCRWLCPYGVLLGLTSLLAWRPVRIHNGECVNCHLCRESCPYGAIEPLTEPLPAKGEAAADRRERRFLILTLLLLPALVWGGVVAGRALTPVLAGRHPLARMVAHAQAAVAGTETLADGSPVDPDMVAGFGRLKLPFSAAADQVLAAQSQLATSLAWLGGLLALALGLAVLAAVRKRRSPEYHARPYACLACARCYQDCPVPEGHGEVP